MTDTPPPDLSALPEPVVRRRGRIRPSLIWLVPILAAVAGLLLLLRAFLADGPNIVITFQTAEGLEAGKTEVRYKNVVLGKLRKIELSEDRKQVSAHVDLTRDGASVAVEDSQFWVERARAGLGGISGITTLVTGTYIGVNVGASKKKQRRFAGLEEPPTVTRDQKGRQFVLTASDLGSVNVGSPVYFRRIQVGRIVSFKLDPDGNGVSAGAFVDEPYDRYVTPDTRFWNASGVDLVLDADGLKVNTQSLVTLLAGGVAFESPSDDTAGMPATTHAPAADGTRFELHASQAVALRRRDTPPMAVRMRFLESTRGLAVDSQVDLKGVALGRITRIELGFDPARARFVTDVSADLYPHRMGRAYQDLMANGVEGEAALPEALFGALIERGLRAQLTSGNLISGQLYVALDFPARVEPIKVDATIRPLQIPTVAASLDQIQARVSDIVTKIDQIPFEDIGKRLRDALIAAESLLRRLDSEVAPAATDTLREARSTLDAAHRSLAAPDAPLQQDLHRSLQEVERTLRSLRDLSDYLQRHPEALIRGRTDSEEPVIGEPD